MDEGDENTILAIQPQLPLSKDIALLLENLLNFYERLSEQTENDERVVLKYIQANRRVGDIHHRLGQSDKARAAYEQAIKRFTKMGDVINDKETLHLELARINNGLGNVLAFREPSQAAKAHVHAQQLLDAVPRRFESDFEMARTLYFLHSVRRDRRGRRGEKDRGPEEPSLDSDIERARELLGTLIEAHGAQPEYRFLLAKCYLATCDRKAKKDGTPEACRRKAVGILEKLVEEYPEAPDYRYELGNAYAAMDLRRGSWRRRGNQPAEELEKSEQRLRKALDVTRHLELDHPNIPHYLILKVRLHYAMAGVLNDMERHHDAEQQYHMAIERQRLVIRLARDPHVHQIWQSRYQLDLARLLASQGQLDQAQARLETITTDLGALVRNPDLRGKGDWRQYAEKNLSRAQETLSELLARRREVEGTE